MKTLIILDGVYSDAKKALCEIIKRNEGQNFGHKLIYKYSTKIKSRKDEINDLKYITFNKAKEHYDEYENNQEKSKWICYKYPIFDKEEFNTQHELYYYCIDTSQIDEYIRTSNFDVGFIIVRNRNCIMELIKRYEKRINVQPVFVYTDYNYIQLKSPHLSTEINIKKWNLLFDEYVLSLTDHNPDYANILIFGCNQDYEISKKDLLTQINSQIKNINSNIEKNLKMESYVRDSLTPKEIRHIINSEEFQSINTKHNENVFIMMKYHGENSGEDSLYFQIKQAFESFNSRNNTRFCCVRADDKTSKIWFPNEKPDVRYWLCTYMCNYGIAIFGQKNKKISLNPNVIYEMGLMRQQGKHVEILIPSLTKEGDVELFFDIKNQWIRRYNKESNIEKEIYECLDSISLHHKR